MTIKTQIYTTRKVMKREKKKMNQLGFRALHTNFIDNDESNGFNVTFVDSIDEPKNSDESIVKDRLTALLIKTLENDTITFQDLKILMRLERDLELKQSTIDKLIVVRQGGLSGIIQRIKNLFGL